MPNGYYREDVSYLESHGYSISDIVSDGLKGLREEFLMYRF
ncbi:hypothetical protein HMPREF9419_1291 [Prevotella nigrescens ATCC 33563]|nr:hypothetical protein HMPREF9419_1291 [Prevotella nigrescens ATCC 33563]